jgi:hypothetical protein
LDPRRVEDAISAVVDDPNNRRFPTMPALFVLVSHLDRILHFPKKWEFRVLDFESDPLMRILAKSVAGGMDLLFALGFVVDDEDTPDSVVFPIQNPELFAEKLEKAKEGIKKYLSAQNELERELLVKDLAQFPSVASELDDYLDPNELLSSK